MANDLSSLLWKMKDTLAGTDKASLDRMFLGLYGIKPDQFSVKYAQELEAAFDKLTAVDIVNVGGSPRAREFDGQKRTAIFGTLDSLLSLGKLAAHSFLSSVPEQLKVTGADYSALLQGDGVSLSKEQRLALTGITRNLLYRLAFERIASPREWRAHGEEEHFQALRSDFGAYFDAEIDNLPELVKGSSTIRHLAHEGVLLEPFARGLIPIVDVKYRNFTGKGLEDGSKHITSPNHRELLAAGMTSFEGILPKEKFGYVPVQIDEVSSDDATATKVSKAQLVSSKTFLIPNPVLRRLGYAQSLADAVMNSSLKLNGEERDAIVEAATAELDLVVRLLEDVSGYVAAGLPQKHFDGLGVVHYQRTEKEGFGFMGTDKPFLGLEALADLKGVDTSVIAGRYAVREGRVRVVQERLEETLREYEIRGSPVVLMPRFEMDAPEIPHRIDVTPELTQLDATNAFIAVAQELGEQDLLESEKLLSKPIAELQALAKKAMDALKAKAGVVAKPKRDYMSEITRSGSFGGDRGYESFGGYKGGFDLGLTRGGSSSYGGSFSFGESTLGMKTSNIQPADAGTVHVTVEPQAASGYDPILTQNTSVLNIPAVIYAGLMTAASLARAAETAVVMLPPETWNAVGDKGVYIDGTNFTADKEVVLVRQKGGEMYDLIARPGHMNLALALGSNKDLMAQVGLGRHPTLELTRLGVAGTFFDPEAESHRKTGSVATVLIGGPEHGYELFLKREQGQ